MPADRDYIVLYRTLVEKKFLSGSGEGKLKQRELEYLGNLIEEKSKIKLSISTLKRLWRNDINQLPHPSTLDALVSILDFRDWQDFKKQNVLVSQIPVAAQNESKKKSLRSIPAVIAVGVILIGAGFFVIQGFNKKDKRAITITKEVVFNADKTITFGVPNTVEFHYDLSGVQADSFFLQQSWNPRDKVSIDPEKKYYSAIYYTPGFHFARIMANDSILKFVNVHIKTQGWMPLVKYEISDKKYMYPDPKAIFSNGTINTTNEILHQANVDLSKDFYLRYYNIRDFEGITSDNFDLETKLKCDKLSFDGRISTAACPLMQIMLVTEENVFFIPVTTKGCVSELDLSIGDVFKDGKDNDLSSLGTDVYEWQTLRIKSENKKATIFLNNSVVHELQYKNDFGDIKGIIYTFTGPGSVDFLRFKDLEGKVVYEDEFN